MVRTPDGALGHRVPPARVCDVLLLALYPMCTAISAGAAPGLSGVPLRLAAGLLCLISPLLPDPGERTALLSGSVPHPPLDWRVAHHSPPGHPGRPRRYSARRFPQWSYD